MVKQKWTTLVVVLFILGLVSVGCLKKDKEEIVSEVDVSSTVEEHWATSTDQGDIYGDEVTGSINGQEINIANVTVKAWEDDNYSWTFSTLAPDETCGVVVGNDAVNFSSKILRVGTFEKKIDEEVEFNDYHAYYHYEQEDGTPISVNVEWSAKIVVKEIDEDNNKIKGYAKVDFDDGTTMIDGKFEADLCK